MDTFTGLLGGGGIPDCAVTGLGVVEEQAPSAFGCNVGSENPFRKAGTSALLCTYSW